MPQPMATSGSAALRELLEPVPKEELARLEEQLPTLRVLVQELVGRGWLTSFQAKAVLEGKAQALFLGQYLLLDKLGEGGMGQVYKARQRNLQRVVALKVIRKECLNNPKIISRFQREMRAVGQLSHPNIVHAFDADQVNGAYFIAMEFIDGVDLAQLVRNQGPLPVDQACDFVRQAALGLQHAFERGFVHRDIKPGNLLLTRNTDKIRASSGKMLRPDLNAIRPPRSTPWGAIKVLDLGLARWQDPATGRASTHLTQMGSVMGTPDFIAPEQARNSHTCDIRADLYSLGCTLYYLLAGRVPFLGGSFAEKLLKHQIEEPDAIAQVRRVMLLNHKTRQGAAQVPRAMLVVPDDVAAIVNKLMAKRPEDRYATPAELAQALDQALDRLAKERPSAADDATACESPLSAVHAEATTEDAPLIKVPTEFGRKPAKSGRKKWWTLGGVSAAAFLAMILAGLGGNQPKPRASDPQPPVPPLDPLWANLEIDARQRRVPPAELRSRLLEYQRQHPERKVEAAELLRALPSPFDAFDRAKMETSRWYAWMPPELVAVLGPGGGGQGMRPSHSVAVSADARWIASGDDRSCRLWDTAGPSMPWGLQTGGWGRVTRVAFSPDSRLLAAASDDGIVRIFDVTSRKMLRSLDRHKRAVTSLAFHPDGNLLASAGFDGVVRLWNPETGAEQAAIQTNTGKVLSLAFSGGFIFWGGDNQEVHWATVLGESPRDCSFTGNTAWVTALHFHPDGRTLITGGGDGTLRLCTFDGRQVREKFLLRGHTKTARDAAFAPDGQSLVSVGEDAQIFLWDTDTGSLRRKWELRIAIHGVAFAPDSRHFVIANANGSLYVLRVKSD